MKYWCKIKRKQCEYAKISGYCIITACIKDGEQE